MIIICLVSTYIEAADIRKKIDIAKLNSEIVRIYVKRAGS